MGMGSNGNLEPINAQSLTSVLVESERRSVVCIVMVGQGGADYLFIIDRHTTAMTQTRVARRRRRCRHVTASAVSRALFPQRAAADSRRLSEMSEVVYLSVRLSVGTRASATNHRRVMATATSYVCP